MRIILRGITFGQYNLKDIGLEGKKIIQVYTILDEENMYAKFDPMTGIPIEKNLDNLNLRHFTNVFLEDRGHDWNVYGNKFKFNSHSNKLDDKVNLLIEYED